MNELSENVSFDSEFALAFEMQPFNVAFFLFTLFSKYSRVEWVKPWLKSCMYTSVFNNIFAELIVNDKEKFRRYLRINSAAYHYFFFA